MKPRAILFDFYGTLGVGRGGREELELALLGEFGSHVEPELLRAGRAAVEARLNGAEHIDHLEFSASSERYAAFLHGQFGGWLRGCGVDPDHPGLFARLCELWDDPSPLYLYDDTLPVLTELRACGYRIGLVSNWSWHLDRILAGTGLAPLLDCTVISARAGYRKPHPEIYRIALAAIGANAADTVFVGDHPDADVAGPRAAGMSPVQIDRLGSAKPLPGVPLIQVLTELPAVLRAHPIK